MTADVRRFAWCEAADGARPVHANCRRTYRHNGRDHECGCDCHDRPREDAD